MKTACVAILTVFGTVLLFAQSNSVPLINNPLVPTSVAPGGPGFTLTVNGTGFTSGSVINWNGNTLGTTFVSSSQLTASVPDTLVAIASTATITVANSSNTRAVSNSAFLLIAAPGSSVNLSGSYIPVNPNSLPVSITAGDFNGDGKIDTATVNAQPTGLVIVLLGQGDGTFAAPTYVPTGSDPQGIVAGDFNEDGKLDLATANFAGGGGNPGSASILLGNGDGTFRPPANFTVGAGAWELTTEDFNRDGHLDLAIANEEDNTVSILLGNGDGTFQGHIDYAVGSGPRNVAVGDFNEDGFLDLVVANYNVFSQAQLSLLSGNGDGTFAPQMLLTPPSGSASAVLADLNGDGHLDIAVADYGSNQLSVFLGNGDGTFQPRLDYPTGDNPNSVIAGDVDGDNKLDLIVVDVNTQSGGDLSVFLGNGDGTFQSALAFVPPTGTPFVLTGADLNNDGKLDFLTGNLTSAVSVLLQTTLSVSKAFLTFHPQLVGTASAPQNVKLTNIGGTALSIAAITITGTNAGDFSQQNNCGTQLAPGATCLIGVTFNPTAPNFRSAALVIADGAVGSPQLVSLTGTGTVVKLSPRGGLYFGNQAVGTKSPPQTITLKNVGSVTLNITKLGITGHQAGEYSQRNTCGHSVPAGASCTIKVVFAPSHVGPARGEVSITDDGGASPQKALLFGIGT